MTGSPGCEHRASGAQDRRETVKAGGGGPAGPQKKPAVRNEDGGTDMRKHSQNA